MGLQTHEQVALFKRTMPELLPSKVLQRKKRVEAPKRPDGPESTVTKNRLEAASFR